MVYKLAIIWNANKSLPCKYEQFSIFGCQMGNLTTDVEHKLEMASLNWTCQTVSCLNKMPLSDFTEL